MPAHWTLVPNRAVLRKKKLLVGANHQKYQLLSLTKGGVIVRDISTGKGKFSSDMGTSQEVRKGDFIFCLFDIPETPRTVGLSSHDGMITSAYTVFEPKRIHPATARYLERFYISIDDRKLLSPLYSGLRNTIQPPRFLGIKTPHPSPEEQAAIVRFLDHTDQKISSFVKAKRQMIKLLNEQRHIAIHQAITKGISPNTPLQASGLDWLGDIPQHWEVVPSKSLFGLRKEKARPDDLMLTASQAHGIISRDEFMSTEGRRVMHVITGANILKHVEPNDFVMSMRSFQGGLEWSKVRGAISSAYVILIPKDSVHMPFFAYVLKSKAYISALRRTSDLVRDGQALRYSNFGQVPLPRVPLKEQQEIAEFLDDSLKELSAAISRSEREISLIEEFRSRLTWEVVSGNLDVREAAAKLPDIDVKQEQGVLELVVDTEMEGIDE